MSKSTRPAGGSPDRDPLPGQASLFEIEPGPNGHADNPIAAEAPNPGRITAEAPNPFDPSKYRLGTNYAAMLGTQEHLLEVPVRKPGKEAWFRVHPTNRMETAVLEIGDDGGDRETFLVDRPLWAKLWAEESAFGPRLLLQYQTRQGVNGLWPIKLPKPGDKINPWTRSALQAATIAETRWVRLQSDRALGAYTAKTSAGIAEEPSWPDYDFGKLLELAFRDRLITSMDHPVLKQLRGEA